jgi:hypothetical protein
LCRSGLGRPGRAGTAIREVGTVVLDYTRTEGEWLCSRQAVTIQRRDPAGGG